MKETEQFLINTLAVLMKIEPAELSLTSSLEEQGVDSFVGLRLIRIIQKETGVDVDLTRILDYPTLRELAGFIDTSR